MMDARARLLRIIAQGARVAGGAYRKETSIVGAARQGLAFEGRVKTYGRLARFAWRHPAVAAVAGARIGGRAMAMHPVATLAAAATAADMVHQYRQDSAIARDLKRIRRKIGA